MRVSPALIVRLVLLAVLVAVAATLGIPALTRVAKFRAVDQVCEAVDRGEWQRALEESLPLLGADPEGLRAAECRCRALLETGEEGACVELLEGFLSDPEVGDWLPEPLMTGLLVARREKRGDLLAAADLAHRGAARYPSSSLLQTQELTLRSRTEDERSVLEEMRRRIEEGGAEGRAVAFLKLRIAELYMARGEWDESLELLGSGPDQFPDEARDSWFKVATQAVAGLGQQERLGELFEDWRRRGGDPYELRARYALVLSTHQMFDAQHPVLDRLAEVIADGDRLTDEELLRGAYIRLIGSLVVGEEHERALAYYDRAVERFGSLEYITREDILRSSTLAALGEERLTSLGGEVRFEVAGARVGDTLLVSPDVDAPVDAPYLEQPVAASGEVRVERRIGTWPQRWVLRDGQGVTVGSGAVWPTPESEVEVRIERRDPSSDRVTDTPRGARRPADGRRRVFQVILDCADWRIIQYGRARGELPFFGRMIDDGRRAVLESIPPFTAVAITKLVYPNKQGTRSVIDLLHQLGAEIQGLNFVGVNPFEPLEWVLPKEGQLFETIAEDGLSTVNLLRSEGSLQVGRQAEVLGPGEQSRQLPGYQGSRSLGDEEERLLGPVEGTQGHLLEEMAADFDVLDRLAEGEPIDFVALRVASLDLMTHGMFQTLNQTGQDDGHALLYRAYRYMDRRLGELDGLLDEDDVLIVMSDHGIRTPMEHDRHALFLASGRGIEPGRVPGTPPIRQVSGWVADLLGVETGWPGSGEGVLTTPTPASQGAPEPAQSSP